MSRFSNGHSSQAPRYTKEACFGFYLQSIGKRERIVVSQRKRRPGDNAAKNTFLVISYIVLAEKYLSNLGALKLAGLYVAHHKLLHSRSLPPYSQTLDWDGNCSSVYESTSKA